MFLAWRDPPVIRQNGYRRCRVSLHVPSDGISIRFAKSTRNCRPVLIVRAIITILGSPRRRFAAKLRIRSSEICIFSCDPTTVLAVERCFMGSIMGRGTFGRFLITTSMTRGKMGIHRESRAADLHRLPHLARSSATLVARYYRNTVPEIALLPESRSASVTSTD